MSNLKRLAGFFFHQRREDTVEHARPEFYRPFADIVSVATEGYDIYKRTDAGTTWTFLINLRSAIINVPE